MAFESVKESGVIWNPCTTGKKKDNTLVQLEANDDSYMIGYFVGTKEVTGGTNNQSSTIHTFKLDKVGNLDHLAGDCPKGEEVKVWGTGVLNDQLSQVNPGAFVRVLWKGKVTSKKSGNPYHTWDVGVDKSVEPLAGATSFSADNTEAAKVETSVAAGDLAGGDEDDLPF